MFRLPLYLRVLLVAALLSWSSTISAAGFDCAKAATPVEKTICADPTLSEADDHLQALFAKALAAAADKDALRTSQRQWLRQRNGCTDAACLGRAYRDRTRQLEAAIGPTVSAGSSSASPTDALAQRRALFSTLQWPQDCEDEFQDQFGPASDSPGNVGSGVQVFSLSGGRKLYQVQCSLAAYQAVFLVLLQQSAGQPGEVLSFKQYERLEDGQVEVRDEPELAGMSQFDPGKGTLTIVSLGRGLGDCGSRVVYGFTGATPNVVEARAQYCSDTPQKANADPIKWPLVVKP